MPEQLAQTRSAYPLGGASWYCPALHTVTAWHCLSAVAVGATDSNVGSVPPMPPPPHLAAYGWQTRAEVGVGGVASNSAAAAEVAHTGWSAHTLSACEPQPDTSYSPAALSTLALSTALHAVHCMQVLVVLFRK